MAKDISLADLDLELITPAYSRATFDFPVVSVRVWESSETARLKLKINFTFNPAAMELMNNPPRLKVLRSKAAPNILVLAPGSGEGSHSVSNRHIIKSSWAGSSIDWKGKTRRFRLREHRDAGANALVYWFDINEEVKDGDNG